LAADPPTVDQVAGRLSCYCGTCPHLVVSQCGCSTADQIKADIKKMIAQGMTEDQIVQSYVAQYGDTVLAAPPGSGFNLAAWAAPFLAFVVGGFVLFTYLKKQQKPPDQGKSRGKPEQAPNSGEPPAEDHYRKVLAEELEKRK
jgi:cytochrome c-type biogenesis protein CcmH